MSTIPTAPATLWHVTGPTGQIARATVVPHAYGFTVVWFRNERVMGAREFESWEAAFAFGQDLESQIRWN